MKTAVDFLTGFATCGALAVTVYFLRLWRDTRDRFFALFGLAFGIFAADWVLFTFVPALAANRSYLGRLVGFLVIVAAIVDKNRAR